MTSNRAITPVPGVTGFSATTGYDLASGLGSVDANLLVNHWTDKAVAAPISLSASSAALTGAIGQDRSDNHNFNGQRDA